MGWDWDDVLHDLNAVCEDLETNLAAVRKLLRLAAEEDHNPEEWAEVLARFNGIKGSVRESYSELETIVAKMLDFDRPIELPDGTIVERRSSSTRKAWKHSEIADLVSERIVESSIDFETGELTRSFPEMVRELLKYAGVQYWKVKPLAELGIDVSDYCETETKDDTASIRKAK